VILAHVTVEFQLKKDLKVSFQLNFHRFNQQQHH